MAFTVPIFTKLTPLLRIFTQLGQEACKWRLDIHFRPRVRCHCHWDDFHKLVLARQLIFSNFLTEFHKSPTTVQSVILRPRQTVRRGLHLWRSYYYFVRNVQLLFSENKVWGRRQYCAQLLILSSPEPVVQRLTRRNKNACCWLARLTSVSKKMPYVHGDLQALSVVWCVHHMI